MARRQANAFGGAVGGAASPAAPLAQPLKPVLQQGTGGGKKGGGDKSAQGMASDPNNPYSTGIPGDITSGAGSDNANENPDDYWTWMAAKSGLNVNPMTPYGAWMGKQNDYYQALYGAAKLDNPNLYFSNFMGSYGFGSPTQPDPKPTGKGQGAPPSATGDATDTGGNHRKRNNNNQQQQNQNDGGRDHKRRKGGRQGGRPTQSPPPPQSGPRGSQ